MELVVKSLIQQNHEVADAEVTSPEAENEENDMLVTIEDFGDNDAAPVHVATLQDTYETA